jgi:hypothetical protein
MNTDARRQLKKLEVTVRHSPSHADGYVREARLTIFLPRLLGPRPNNSGLITERTKTITTERRVAIPTPVSFGVPSRLIIEQL